MDRCNAYFIAYKRIYSKQRVYLLDTDTDGHLCVIVALSVACLEMCNARGLPLDIMYKLAREDYRFIPNAAHTYIRSSNVVV